MSWRVLHIDWYERGLLAHTAWRYVRESFGPMIPLRVYWMLKHGHFKSIINGLTVRRP